MDLKHVLSLLPIGDDFLQATLLLFCSMAKRSATAEALQACGVTEHLVIALSFSYSEKAKEEDLIGWRLSLRLYDSLLRTMQMRFGEDVAGMGWGFYDLSDL